MRKIILFITVTFLLSLPVFAQQKQDILIRNATVLTAARGTLPNTDVL